MDNARERAPRYPDSTMAQANLAFITGHSRGERALDASLALEVERYVELGRKNVVIVMDTFPDLGEGTIAALLGVLRRASELGARVSCVAMDERIVSVLRPIARQHEFAVIQRVDQIPGAAA